MNWLRPFRVHNNLVTTQMNINWSLRSLEYRILRSNEGERRKLWKNYKYAATRKLLIATDEKNGITKLHDTWILKFAVHVSQRFLLGHKATATGKWTKCAPVKHKVQSKFEWMKRTKKEKTVVANRIVVFTLNLLQFTKRFNENLLRRKFKFELFRSPFSSYRNFILKWFFSFDLFLIRILALSRSHMHCKSWKFNFTARNRSFPFRFNWKKLK